MAPVANCLVFNEQINDDGDDYVYCIQVHLLPIPYISMMIFFG